MVVAKRKKMLVARRIVNGAKIISYKHCFLLCKKREIRTAERHTGFRFYDGSHAERTQTLDDLHRCGRTRTALTVGQGAPSKSATVSCIKMESKVDF